MKLYLFLAIVVCKSCNYFSHAEYDSLVDWANRGPSEADASLEGALAPEFEWSPYGRPPWTSAVKRSAKADIQTRRRSSLDKNFMRFGRADPQMVRYSRASNLMRFGRPDRNFMRFGRDSWAGAGPEQLDLSTLSGADDLSKEYATSTEQLEQADATSGLAAKRNAAGGASEEMMAVGLSESGEQIRPKQVVYYRRDSPKNLMRFGKRRPAGASGYMRFGRANLMRFGRRSDEPELDERAPLMFGRVARASNLMRFGRAGNLMRFGRSGPSETVPAEPARNQPSNGTSSLPAAQATATLPANLLELLDGDRMVPGLTKEQELALLDAMEGADGGAAQRVGSNERLPLYVVEK
ncbi:AGAP005518-PA-like protein [Anopheles sinensis]|uniref:AGAP005518-PA-like protein n=1 Tax=Anopheles sinensis TaxID=74873 RepID=A0A084VZ95_ANOSI|nr:AGAP005518-PA-like protein [Anopheles sinensis]